MTKKKPFTVKQKDILDKYCYFVDKAFDKLHKELARIESEACKETGLDIEVFLSDGFAGFGTYDRKYALYDPKAEER